MEKEQELISVIVPIYNTEDYLDKCIQSICEQTYQNLEIILVNDGSTDSSLKICEHYAKKDCRIQIVDKPNGGHTSARKAGLQIASGNYIAWVDSDDWLEKEAYEILYEAMMENEVDIVCMGTYVDYSTHTSKSIGSYPEGIYEIEELYEKLIYNGVFFECGVLPDLYTKLFRRHTLETIVPIVDERIKIGEDGLITYGAILNANKIQILDYYGYHYVQRLHSITRCSFLGEVERLRYLYDLYHQVLSEKGVEQIFNHQILSLFQFYLLLRDISSFDRQTAMLENVLIPYGGIEKEEQVVLYGAGTFGQKVRTYLLDKEIKPLKWLDKQWELYQKEGYEVEEPEIIKNLSFDKIIIAVTQEKVAKAIQRDLEKLGVEKKKLSWFTEDFFAEKELVKKIIQKE